jgi:GNAT superfamily N-acetyltransferase
MIKVIILLADLHVFLLFWVESTSVVRWNNTAQISNQMISHQRSLLLVDQKGEFQMDKSQMLDLFTQDQRIDVTYPNLRREVMPTVVRLVDTSGEGEGVVYYSQLTAANADKTIREQVAYFESLGQDFEWKLFDYDQPSDLKERLAAHGFSIGEEEAVMALALRDVPAVLWHPVWQDVRKITSIEKIVDVLTVKEQVWNDGSSGLRSYLEEALRHYPAQMSIYVAYVDDQPACAGWVYFPTDSQFAGLWGGSTISKYRKRGLYTALLAVRAQEARERNVRYLTVDASPMSRPILEKFGFEILTYSYACHWKRKTGGKQGVDSARCTLHDYRRGDARNR